jgi:hypothetical protein
MEASIPFGGFARAYDDRVEIWRHCDKCTSRDHLHTYPYSEKKCYPSK